MGLIQVRHISLIKKTKFSICKYDQIPSFLPFPQFPVLYLNWQQFFNASHSKRSPFNLMAFLPFEISFPFSPWVCLYVRLYGCGKSWLNMPEVAPKIIPKTEWTICEEWMRMRCWFFAYYQRTIETSDWFRYFRWFFSHT